LEILEAINTAILTVLIFRLAWRYLCGQAEFERDKNSLPERPKSSQ